jgi:hypothetical protein
MTDVLLSYASEDSQHAARMAQALEREGWSVWWDRQIPPGRTWDQVIGEATQAARCVVVLWSRNATAAPPNNWRIATGAGAAIIVAVAGIAYLALRDDGTPQPVPSPTPHPVPDVVGKSLPDARRLIAQAGLAVGELQQQITPSSAPGTVLAQRPAAGKAPPDRGAVALVVSAEGRARHHLQLAARPGVRRGRRLAGAGRTPGGTTFLLNAPITSAQQPAPAGRCSAPDRADGSPAGEPVGGKPADNCGSPPRVIRRSPAPPRSARAAARSASFTRRR